MSKARELLDLVGEGRFEATKVRFNLGGIVFTAKENRTSWGSVEYVVQKSIIRKISGKLKVGVVQEFGPGITWLSKDKFQDWLSRIWNDIQKVYFDPDTGLGYPTFNIHKKDGKVSVVVVDAKADIQG